MMFDTKPVIEAELIAERELAPKLAITLGRRHARFAPNMREMSEFHGLSHPFEPLAFSD
jgi:hypothetical protein